MTTVGNTFAGHQELLIGARVVTDLSASQHLFVKQTAADEDGTNCGLVSAATDKPIGVLQKGAKGTATVGHAAEVCHKGETQVLAGAAVAIGALIQADATARAITAASSGYSCGVALTSCTVAGELITISMDCAALRLIP
jgi:hypothetical protein